MNKIILITGTSRGIGEYLAKYFLGQGDKVIGCSRSHSGIQDKNYSHYEFDITNSDNIRTLFNAIRKKYGSLDLLINNAAINPMISYLALIPDEVIEDTIFCNLISPIKICREAVKLMIKKKSGRIINIGSMAVKLEVEGETLYTATKSALHSFSRVLAKEVYSSGITVNIVSPSVVFTDLSSKIDKEKLSKVLQQNAIREWGSFKQIANIIEWLAKDESSEITGQNIYLGGV